jgi:hypothetical protein
MLNADLKRLALVKLIRSVNLSQVFRWGFDVTKQNKNDFLFDNRIAQRNIRDGRVVSDDYEKYLSSLPDLSDKCEDIGEEIYSAKKPGLALTGEFVSNEQDE